jgi:hypothetical protein
MIWRNLVSLVLVTLAAVLAVGTSDSGGGSSGSDASSSKTSSVDLSGSQFVITNNDSFDWANCKLEVNPEFIGSGYKYEGASLRAGETYSVGALQFANGDGERFNPFTHKPQKFSISCDTPRGSGFYYGGWK